MNKYMGKMGQTNKVKWKIDHRQCWIKLPTPDLTLWNATMITDSNVFRNNKMRLFYNSSTLTRELKLAATHNTTSPVYYFWNKVDWTTSSYWAFLDSSCTKHNHWASNDIRAHDWTRYLLAHMSRLVIHLWMVIYSPTLVWLYTTYS